jgi:hypothetical protein
VARCAAKVLLPAPPLRDANARTFIDAPKPDQTSKELGNNGEQQVKPSASRRLAIYKFLSLFSRQNT